MHYLASAIQPSPEAIASKPIEADTDHAAIKRAESWVSRTRLDYESLKVWRLKPSPKLIHGRPR